MNLNTLKRRFNQWMWNHQTRLPVRLWNFWAKRSSFPREMTATKILLEQYDRDYSFSGKKVREIRKFEPIPADTSALDDDFLIPPHNVKIWYEEEPWPDAKKVEFKKFDTQPVEEPSEYPGFTKAADKEMLEDIEKTFDQIKADAEEISPEERREIWEGICEEVHGDTTALREKQAEERAERIKKQAKEWHDNDPLATKEWLAKECGAGEIDYVWWNGNYNPMYFGSMEELITEVVHGNEIGMRMEVCLYKVDGQEPEIDDRLKNLDPFNHVFIVDNPFA